MQPEDQRLLQQIARGDQEAFKILYTKYRNSVYRFLWYQLDRDAHRAEDLVQEVFLQVWRSARQYHDCAQVITWILSIARHLAANAKRNRTRRVEGHLVEQEYLARREEAHEWEEEHVYSFSPSHEDAVVNRLALTQALQCLPVKYREVLDLVFYQGLSLHDAAQVLDIPLGTVKSRLSTARHTLLAHLERVETSEGNVHEE
jgi:RNA polymerase sigma-70 factor (ECF subfamily)